MMEAPMLFNNPRVDTRPWSLVSAQSRNREDNKRRSHNRKRNKIAAASRRRNRAQ